MRHRNKSIILREIFKWIFITVSLSYLAIQIIGRGIIWYDEVREMVQDEDRDKLRKEEYDNEKMFAKIIPDFFSYWTLVRAIVIVIAAFLLITIQKEEELEAKRKDEQCMITYTDIHYHKWNNPNANLHNN